MRSEQLVPVLPSILIFKTAGLQLYRVKDVVLQSFTEVVVPEVAAISWISLPINSLCN